MGNQRSSKCMSQKKKLYRQFLIHRTFATERKYKQYKNKLTAILRKEKRNTIVHFYMKTKTILGVHIKYYEQYWENIKINMNSPIHLTTMGGPPATIRILQISLMIFFTNVGPDLAKNIITLNVTSIFDYMQNRNDTCMFLTPVDEMEVSRMVKSCKNKYSTDSNELSMYVVKRIIVNIVTSVTHICNLSFKKGVFPDKMKIGKIIPIYKSGKRENCTNYRPISLPPQI